MLRWRLALVPLFVLSMASAPSEFQGCSCGAPATSVPLPRVDGGFCSDDEQCSTGDLCHDVRCIAGSCVEVGMLDRDGDGIGPPPCGGDCNDFDALISPEKAEICDGVDNDCDDDVDENALPAIDVVNLSGGDAHSVVVPWGDAFLITSGSDPIQGRRMDRFGTLSTPMSLFHGPARLLEAEANDSGVVLLAEAVTGENDILFVSARSDSSGLAVVGAEHRIVIDGELLQFALAHSGDTWVIVYDVLGDDAHVERNFATILEGADASPPVLIHRHFSWSPHISLASYGGGYAIDGAFSEVHLVNSTGNETQIIERPADAYYLAHDAFASHDGDLFIAYENGDPPSFLTMQIAQLDIGDSTQTSHSLETSSEYAPGDFSMAFAGESLLAWRSTSSTTYVRVYDTSVSPFARRAVVDHTVLGGIGDQLTVATRGNTTVLLEPHTSNAAAIFVRDCVMH